MGMKKPSLRGGPFRPRKQSRKKYYSEFISGSNHYPLEMLKQVQHDLYNWIASFFAMTAYKKEH